MNPSPYFDSKIDVNMDGLAVIQDLWKFDCEFSGKK